MTGHYVPCVGGYIKFHWLRRRIGDTRGTDRSHQEHLSQSNILYFDHSNDHKDIGNKIHIRDIFDLGHFRFFLAGNRPMLDGHVSPQDGDIALHYQIV